MNIKVIVFDIGGVLVSHSPKQHSKKFERHFKVPARVIHQTWQKHLTRVHTGKITTREFYTLISNAIKKEKVKTISWKELNKFNVQSLKPMKRVRALAKKLKKKYKTFILSNIADFFPAFARAHQLHEHVHTILVSYKLGCEKPSAKIYKHLIQKAKCKPEEIFFIDDLKKYVNGAKKMGIHAVQFNGYSQLVKDLRKAGVSWK